MRLQIENLSRRFYQGQTEISALDNVSFSVSPGESLAITGPSGSGKTTLLSLMAGLESPSAGKIIFGDTDISQLSERERTDFRAANIGIVFQQFHLMPHLTALENVCLPLEILGKPFAQSQALEILKNVGLSERAHHLPHQMSGGECQRVAIARAMVHKPPFIFADEPSGNLDTSNGQKVMDLLFSLISEQKRTLILITHDQQLAERCDHQIHLLGGRKQ